MREFLEQTRWTRQRHDRNWAPLESSPPPIRTWGGMLHGAGACALLLVSAFALIAR